MGRGGWPFARITIMAQPTLAAGTGRLLSLDAFRGATMALMILVNNAGDGKHVYWPLEHAEWHGWTPTDVVFPSFLWIVGVAITLVAGPPSASAAIRGRRCFDRLPAEPPFCSSSE